MADALPEIVARCNREFEEDKKHHDLWSQKVDRWYRAYRGEYDDEREHTKYRSDFTSRYIFQIVETLASGLSDPAPRWKVSPRPKSAPAQDIMALQEGAKQLERLLAYQRDVDGMVLKQRTHRLQGLIAGLSVWKTYWRLEETTEKRTRQRLAFENGDFIEVQEEYEQKVALRDDPCVDVVDVRDFIWPESATSIETAPRLHHRVFKTYDELLDAQKAGLYQNVEMLKEKREGSGDGTLSNREQGVFQVDRTKDRITVVEHWIDHGKRVVTIANGNVLLRDVSNPFKHLGYPFVGCSPLPELFRIPGISAVELVFDLQRMVWDLQRQRHDNLEITNNQIMLIPDNALHSDYTFAPGEQWLVEAMDNAPKALELPTYPVEVSLQAEQILKADIQGIVGASPALIGQTDQIEQTATEVSLMANLAQRRLASQKQQFTVADVRVAEQWISLNGQFMSEPRYVAIVGPDGDEGWQLIDPASFKDGQFSVQVEQMDKSLVRQERLAESQSRFQVALTAAGPMAAMQTPLNLRAFVEDILDDAGIENKDRYFSQMPQPGVMGQTAPTGVPGPTPDDQGVSAPQATSMAAPSNPFSMSPVAATSRMLSMNGGASNAP